MRMQIFETMEEKKKKKKNGEERWKKEFHNQISF